MAFRIRRQVTSHALARDRAGIAALAFDPGNRRLLQLGEFAGRKGGFLEDLGDKPERIGELGTLRVYGRAFGADGDMRIHFLERFLDLRARMPARAAHEHPVGERAGSAAVDLAGLVPPVQGEARDHVAAARFLGQQAKTNSVRKRFAHEARLDVRRRRVERVAQFGRLAAGIACEGLFQVRHRGNVRPRQLVGRNERTHDPVRRLKVRGSNPLHVLHGDFAQPVAVEIEKTPVAARAEFRQVCDQGEGIDLDLLEIVEQRGLRALDLLGAHGFACQILGCREQRVARGVERRGFEQGCPEKHGARIVKGAFAAPDRARQALLHQGAMKPPGGLGCEQVHENVHGRVVLMASRRNAIKRADHLGISRATKHHTALAILRRLRRVQAGQLARGPGNRSKMPGHHRQCFLLLELSPDDENGVVGLIVGAVKGLQALDGDVFDVGARADDGVAVVVPAERELHHALAKDAARIVLARFEFVPDHCHLAVEIGLAHVGVQHPVGFDAERPVEILFRRAERLEIIGAVVRRGAVEAHATPGEFLLQPGIGGRALEQHVLEQVGHALFAIALVARPDQVGDVDHHRIDRAVGNQQDLQPVVQPVFGHALHTGDSLRCGRKAGQEGKAQKRAECEAPEGSGEGHDGFGCSLDCIGLALRR